MTYLINAWFERDNPYLKVIHKDSGIPILSWQGEMLKERLDAGSISIEDFSNSHSQELVKELFLIDCLQLT